MSRKAETIRDEALKLPIEERSCLADDIRESTLTEEERAIQAEWIEVAERRLDELQSGKVKGIPWEGVLEGLNAKLRTARRRSSRSR